MNGELKDVARGKIVTPLLRVMHNTPMPEDVFRVTLTRVFSGCGALDPPSQPAQADSELNLEQCVVWPLTWPKALIRLDTATLEATPDQVKHGDHDGDEDDHHDDDPNDYLNDDPYGDGSQPPTDDAPLEKRQKKNHDAPDDQPLDKSRCNKRLFSSQDAPVVGSDQVGLSGDELQGAVKEGFGKEKKHRKRQRRIMTR